MKKSLLFLLSLFITQSIAQNAYIPPEEPRLVIGIVIEQFRYDYSDKYWDSFGDGGCEGFSTVFF